MEIAIPKDLKNHEIHYFVKNMKLVTCNVTDVLSIIYSLIYDPVVSFNDYQSLKNDFERRSKVIEECYNIGEMIDVVTPIIEEGEEWCTIDPEKPFTVIMREKPL